MSELTNTYRVVTVLQDGNHNALVFREPKEGQAYHANQMWSLPGAVTVQPNDEGDIPHREIEPGDDQLDNDPFTQKYGLTWHFAK